MTAWVEMKKHSHRGTETQRRPVGTQPISLCLCASVALFGGRR